MTLRLQYKAVSSVPVEVEGVTPDAVRDQSLADIEKLNVFRGNEQLPLAELFDVAGDPADEKMEWEGDLAGVHWIAAKMSTGEVHVNGNGGRHIGSQMRGGEVHVAGDASDWVGGEMRGGTIHVRGSAGHLVGAAYRGSARGMLGGTILIGGKVGNELGHTMRRGVIVVRGNVGDLAGFNMLAGTILICGESGIRHAAGMKRGTLAFLGDHRPPLLPTFRHACRYRPEFLPVLLRHIASRGMEFPGDAASAMFDLYHGDMIEGGRGEILTRVT